MGRANEVSVRGGQRPCGYKNQTWCQTPIAGYIFDWYHAGLTPHFMRPKHRWHVTKVHIPCAKVMTFCDHHVLHILSVFSNEMPFQEVLRTFNASGQTVSHIWIRAEKCDFVKFYDYFRFKMSMQYEQDQSTLRELRHISTILTCAKPCK